MKSFALPIILVTIGTGWMLSALNLYPSINWVWVLGLLVSGVVTFLVMGVTKTSVVIAPLLVLSSGLSLLRQLGRLNLELELPILLIAFGVLLAVARNPKIRA